MSRSNNGKCPDIGQWCGVVRELCEGDCMVKRIEDLEAENARLKAALKPVLDLPDSLFRNWFGRVFEAIRESRMIYDGGAE